jgi:hypothetical protein
VETSSLMAELEQPKKYRVGPAEYGVFISQIEIHRVFLVSASIKRTRLPAEDATLNYNERIGRSKFELTESGFRALYPYSVEFTETGSESPFGQVTCTFAAEYKSEQEMSTKIFSAFRELNLPLNVWPYVREYIHSTTNRMGLPAVILRSVKR